MAKKLVSERVRVGALTDAFELFWDKGWTDGLPIVPPTEDKVLAFLDYAGLEPDQVLGQAPERNCTITAEKAAINAVMAGCLPEYMPVIVAAVEALTAPEYYFNHLASVGSPWPAFIINGPVVKELKFNAGSYVLGGGHRANATIARAISLLLSNCAGARSGGIQAGQWGNVIRCNGCLAENEDTPWMPLHVQLGFAREASVVTAISTQHPPFMARCLFLDPKRMLDAVLAGLSRMGFLTGVYVLLVPPNIVDVFHRNGWTKNDVRDYVLANCRESVADLKRMARWGQMAPDVPAFFGDPNVVKIEPRDEQKYVYLFGQNPEYDRFLFGPTHKARKTDIYVVACGGYLGPFIYVLGPYGASTQPISREIRMR